MSSINNLRSKAIADLLPGTSLPEATAQINVTGLNQDSRKIVAGHLFIAVAGHLTDGRNYIDQAIAAGAVAVVAQAESEELRFIDGVPVIGIQNLPQQVSAIAAEFYDWPAKKLTTVAVTGTNGKTSCVVLLCNLLQLLGKKTAFIGTMGYGFFGEALQDTGLTTPDPIACQRMLADLLARGAEFVAMEASSHAIAQYRLEAIHFDGLVFTNLTRDHLDYHPDLESYQAAKLRLFQFPGVKFIVANAACATGEKIQAMASAAGTACTAYSAEGKGDFFVQNKRFSLQGIEAEVQSPWGKGKLRSNLVAPFNLHNLLAVIGCALHLGYSLSQVLAQIPTLRPVRGRLEKISVNDQQAIHVFVDYAHTPDALQKSLEPFAERNQQGLWLVFGCGGDRDKGKRAIMGEIAGRLAEKVVLTSDNPRSEDPEAIVSDIFQGVAEEQRHKVARIVERQEAISYTIASAEDNDIVVVAGKGHEDYQIIKGERHFFDDAEVVKRCLQQRCALSGGV